MALHIFVGLFLKVHVVHVVTTKIIMENLGVREIMVLMKTMFVVVGGLATGVMQNVNRVHTGLVSLK